MGASMSYMTFDYLAARPAAERAERSNFGLVAMFVLALASAMVGIVDPAAIVAEYQTDMVTLTGP
jgi:hypothetical protein